MVSLRERKSRPSYAAVHAALDGLSDEDERAPAAGDAEAEVGGSGDSALPAGTAKKVKRKRTTADDGSDIDMREGSPGGSVASGTAIGSDDAASLSSGDSSDFAPSEASGKPKRGRPAGKGKAGVKASGVPSAAESDSEVASEDLSDEDIGDDDDDVVMEDDVADDGFVHVTTPPRKAAKAVRPAPVSRGSTSAPGGAGTPSIGAPAGQGIASASGSTRENNINDFPVEYRTLLKTSTQEMAKVVTAPSLPPPARIAIAHAAQAASSADKGRIPSGLEWLPYGPRTPYLTRLTRPPAPELGGSRTSEVKVLDGGKEVERRERSLHVARAMSWLSPWQAWEGDSWWPEMGRGALPGAETSLPEAGPSRPAGWRSREEVRLGLDHVGRATLGTLDIILESEASGYMAAPRDSQGQPSITVHIGPYGSQAAQTITMLETRSTRDLGGVQEGFVGFAGGPIWGLDWCPLPERVSAHLDNTQHLAVSCLPHIDTRPTMGEKRPAETPASIQIWSVVAPLTDHPTDGHSEPGKMMCEMVLCVRGGPAMQLKWMPMGAWDEIGAEEPGLPKLGVLAAVQLDGSVSFYPVPRPQAVRQAAASSEVDRKPIYLRMDKPLVKLQLPDASVLCIDWITGTKLAAGLSNGHAVVWDVGPALRSSDGPSGVLPSAYITLALSPIRTIACARIPPGDEDGRPMYASEPTHLVYGSLDGTLGMADIRDPAHPVDFGRQRAPLTAVGYSTQLACPLQVDVDYQVVLRKQHGSNAGKIQGVSVHRGPVWDISASEYHNSVLSAGSDGAVIVGSTQSGFLRTRRQPVSFYRLYEIDYDEPTGHYRMTDHFLPEIIAPEAVGARRLGKRAGKGAPGDVESSATAKSAAWSPHVGIHRVACHNAGGLGKAGWVASGGAAGLVRVDWVSSGRWHDGVTPDQIA